MKCPSLLPVIVVADDARLAAQLSCVLARPGAYLSVIDGPRMARSDRDAEATRRNNAVARIQAMDVFYAGLPAEADAALERYLRPLNPRRITSRTEIRTLAEERGGTRASLLWGRDRIGLGLLTALRTGKEIEFTDETSPTAPLESKSDHLVVCEAGEDLSEVIAANYAFALKAGLCIIPERPKHETRDVLEAFYGLNEIQYMSPTQKLRELAAMLRALCGDIILPTHGSVTFVTDGLPYGFAFPEVPSTRLFKYPDLGLAIINGFAAEQPKTRGTNVAVLIDPLQTDAPEIDAAADTLAKRGMFVRGHRGVGATVYEVSRMIELYPYDLLVLATHCGDANGYRWTYQFIGSDGRDRNLVVDIAVGIADARRNNDDKLEVITFERFHALDGVLWDDPDRFEKINVGRALLDYAEWTKSDQLQPVLKEDIPRVAESAALKMYDHNYLAIPHALADNTSPIIINNACASWRELAQRFTFANARAYVGTLFPIATTEAHDVVIGALGKHFEKVIPHAFWSAQNSVYGDSVRRPYIVTGVYPQRLRVTNEHTPSRVFKRMQSAVDYWRRRFTAGQATEQLEYKMRDTVEFYEREINTFGTRRMRP